MVAAALCALTMAACTVNWFGGTVEVPWYAVAIPVFLVAALGYIILMTNIYVCPHCKTEFRAKPYQLSVTVHANRRRLAKCPCCKKTSFCKVKRR